MDPSYTNLLTANINDNTVPDLIIFYPSSVSKDANFPNITHAYHHNVQFKYQIIYDLHLATTHHGSYRGLRNSRPFIKPSESSFSNSFDVFELECESEYIDGVWANYNFPLSFTSTVTDLDSNGRPDVVIVSVVRNIGVLKQGFAIKVIVLRNLSPEGVFHSVTYSNRVVHSEDGMWVHDDPQNEFPHFVTIDHDRSHGFGDVSILRVTHSLGRSILALHSNGSVVSFPYGYEFKVRFSPIASCRSSFSFTNYDYFILSLNTCSNDWFLFRSDFPSAHFVSSGVVDDGSPVSLVRFIDSSESRPTFLALVFQSPITLILTRLYLCGDLNSLMNPVNWIVSILDHNYYYQWGNCFGYIVSLSVSKPQLWNSFTITPVNTVRNGVVHTKVLKESSLDGLSQWSSWRLIFSTSSFSGQSLKKVAVLLPSLVELPVGTHTFLIGTDFPIHYARCANIHQCPGNNARTLPLGTLHVQGFLTDTILSWPINLGGNVVADFPVVEFRTVEYS
ncbi:hypothetical protein RCL1_006155 [Eukaryota sp. TZLM3-RCL]